MVLKALRVFALAYTWIWAMTWCLANVSCSETLIKFNVSKFHRQISDGFVGIEGTKRKKQGELLLQMALAYLCLQFVLKSLAYFAVYSFRKPNARKKNETETIGISMIRIN